MKGTRLPEDWTLPEEYKTWAKTERPDLNPERIAEEFRDYWIAKTGQGATKLDWFATWRNWIRRTRQEHAGNRPQSHVIQRHKKTTIEQWAEAKELAARHLAGLKGAARGVK